MKGTHTLSLRFKNVRIPATDVLAHPEQFNDYIRRIKAGFVLGQTGMGFGVTEGCLKTIRECNVSHAHVNQFLDCQGDELASELARLKQQATGMAAEDQESGRDTGKGRGCR